MARGGYAVIAAGVMAALAHCSSGVRQSTEPGDIGDPCTTDSDCRTELICRPDDTCGPCVLDSDCGTELVCRSDGTCGPGGFGDPCVEDTDCRPEFVCGDRDTCTQRGVGDPCTEDGDCGVGLVCRSDGLCGAGGPGEPCTADTDCSSGFVCRGDGMCGPRGLGDACTVATDCRWDLICRADGTCGPAGATAEGEACTYTEDCVAGLACLWERDEAGTPRTVCRPAGGAAAGEFCGTTSECARGLVCVTEGFGGRCRAPASDGDLGYPCATLADCAAGLACSAASICVRAVGADGGPGFPVWEGVDCAPPEAAGSARFYFEIPRGPLAPGHDFFRLPWPNDIRKTADGHLDLTGFPHPGTARLPVDVLDRFLRAAERDLTGYGTNGAVFFRSSRSLDWSTLYGDDRIYWVDLTPPALPTDPHGRLGFGWAASTGGGRYLCQDWLASRSPLGWSLLPGRTYAVVISTGVCDAAGDALVQDADFAQVLLPTRPTGDDAVARAWDAYAPFRAYLAHDGIAPGTILVAAQFTTQDVPATLRRAKEVVGALATPVATDLVQCTTGAMSACDDGLAGGEHERGCFGEDPAFFEVQGRFPTPVFQAGTAPYLTPADGGGFVFDASGRPERQRDEPICFALSVPRGAPMPAGGWPVVVHAHGTGGSYRSFITDGVAGQLAAVTLADGSVQRFAVLSFDEPQHGERRGSSAEDPEILFFNFMNPDAAYGNVLQGAIDGWQAARLLAGTSWDAVSSPIGDPVRFDAARTYFYGHSQGATHGVLTAAFDASFDAAVFSGAGGSLIESLLTKTSPYDVPGAVRMALGDLDIGGVHPALTVFQMVLEVADPVNYGRYIISSPLAPVTAKDVLQVYGLRDTYSPRETQVALAVSIGVAVAEPVLEDLGLPTAALPASGNRNPAGVPTTAVLSQHDPAAGADGHFVATQDDVARRRVAQFFATAARDGTPTVVP